MGRPKAGAIPGRWLALVLLLLAGCVPSEVKRDLRQFSGMVIRRPSHEAVLVEPRKNVVTVLALGADNRPVGFGSGFYVRSNQVVTCLHVIEAATRLAIELPDGMQYPVAGIFATDPLMDAAVLWVTNPPPSLQPLRLRQRPAIPQETAYALGTSDRLDGLPISATKGIVIQVLDAGMELMNSSILLSVPVLQGFSGGPVLDEAGEVIGVTGQIATRGKQRESVAIPVEFIRPLTEGPPMEFHQWQNRFPPPPARACAEVAAGELLGAGQEAEALRHFQWALALAPDYVHARVRNASCLMRMGRFAEAITNFQQALKIEPGMVMPRIRLTHCLLSEKRPEEALREAQKVLELRPNSFASHACLVAAQMANADLIGALRTAQDSIRLAPADRFAQLMMGQLWDRVGGTEQAEAFFDQAIQLHAEGPAIWMQAAALKLEREAYDPAAAALKRVLDFPDAPERAGAEYLLVTLALRSGNRLEADQHFAGFVEAERNDFIRRKVSTVMLDHLKKMAKADISAAATHQTLAGLFERTGRPHERLAAMETAARLAPDDARVWSALARTCCYTWRYDRARAASLRSIGLKPNPQAYQTLGIACAATDRLAEARQALLKAVALGGRSAEDLLALASVEAKAGRTEVAREYVTEAFQRNPKLPRQYEAAPEKFIPDANRIRQALSRPPS